jgi:Glycosyltransferase family 87
MSRIPVVISTILVVCLALATFGGLVWANTIFMHTQPVEKDFLIPWLGARTFIQYGESPYGDPATQRAQIIYYGRLASAGQDPLMLWLPFPVELFYFPIALVPDYVLAKSIWTACLEAALVALGFLSLRLTGWKPGRGFLPVILLFPLLWVYGAFSLISGNVSGFIALALAGFLLALKTDRDELAGGLLILLVSAPRLTGVLAFFIVWWLIYQHRWRVFWGFLMGVIVLFGLAFLFLPDWLLAFLRGLLSHYSYNPGLTSTAIFASWSPVVGLRLGWVLAAGLLLVLFFVWGNTLVKDFRNFLWTACLTLAMTPLLGIPLVPREYPFLTVPLMLFLAILAERRPWHKRWHISGIVTVVILVSLWFLTFYMVRAKAAMELDHVLFLILPIMLVVVLTWVRWWFIHTIPTGLEKPP